ncbi:hypothetical protein [Staphylococcus aureus]|uniref:hypothetical protein n=1 Tax=Staphylococcus aureus TaxID=1280 RepID=UPI000B9570CB|nr:hypothetical protein [Staphylococcus aureus]HCV1856342.1 hypothetical protein [Staphylococcus aureus]HCV3933020.1 hypothetical protein [Staphylococcus aureus]
MNYKERVTLLHRFDSKYNPTTKRKEIIKDEIGTFACNVNALTAENVRLEFGEVSKDINVIRLPTMIEIDIPTHAIIADKLYKVVKLKHYAHTTSIYAKELV